VRPHLWKTAVLGGPIVPTLDEKLINMEEGWNEISQGKIEIF
jgi:hypothetical protein